MCQKWRVDEGFDELTDDILLLKALVVAGRAREARLKYLIAHLQHARFGALSEELTPDQLALALEDVAVAEAEAEALRERVGA